MTGGTAETTIRDRTTGNIYARSTTDTVGDNVSGSTLTRVADTDRDRSTVVGTSDSVSYGATGGTSVS